MAGNHVRRTASGVGGSPDGSLRVAIFVQLGKGVSTNSTAAARARLRGIHAASRRVFVIVRNQRHQSIAPFLRTALQGHFRKWRTAENSGVGRSPEAGA